MAKKESMIYLKSHCEPTATLDLLPKPAQSPEEGLLESKPQASFGEAWGSTPATS